MDLGRKFISGLVLGAGASSRFGQPKQLLPYGGSTLLGWVINQAERSTGLDEVIVVLGRAADEIREKVVFGNAKVAENPVFGEGCASSYRAGVGALDPRSDAIMILLGDQPGVDPETINRMAAEWRRGDGQIALASYQGRKGHPMLFAKPLFDKLVGLHGDKAAWKLVDANPDLVRVIPFDRPFPEDINTLEDFQRAAEHDPI
ncbi:MAG TPA: nucleotidyltransferase family protein [Blastocatellia bacterium]|jgi:molybdenum cofactor cytidylyltransferase|nr:nucleotidyltransferase family protein [Blastocatellia bacterium]